MKGIDARDAYKCFTVHRTAPMAKEDPVPNVSGLRNPTLGQGVDCLCVSQKVTV